MVIADILFRQRADSAIILAPSREPLRQSGLAKLIEDTARRLALAGVNQADRIAVVLPNGPELATAFLSVSACAAIAPLNPAYSAQEFRFYLSDLKIGFLITQENFCEAANATARSLGIPVILLKPLLDEAAGVFALELQTLPGAGLRPRYSGPDDLALLLHTSGTTARPKLIPLTHRNLTASAGNIAATLSLSPDDLCLNIMPLFHIHGLIGALLSSIAAGCPVYCTSGFNPLHFHRALRESRATWYTAVPTMHQMILARRESGASVPRLRFVRSSSAHLHPLVGTRLEEYFECPALNTYGMTEASHQISANTLPPARRKHGTVGIPERTRVTILDQRGTIQPDGSSGEVAIRGDAVMHRYLAPEEANRTAFHEGWLRTGDLGVIDPDGYLTLTGRIKEILNCGGEKVSPAEIDEVLLTHPDVASAVCFGSPCQEMGERICAAVTLTAGSGATETELKVFVRDRLAKFKVPRRILIVPEIPCGATGKIQRIGMAERLGVA